jgi:very-short-patch-repair endonuclease
MKRLVQSGYHVIPQWKVGSRSIDLVVEGNGRRLAIECDGDRELPLEKLRDDLERQSMLERLGWTFARVRGSIFLRDPDRAMNPVFDKLRSMDIAADGPSSDRAHGPANLDELTERVILRADSLREEWSAPHDKHRLRAPEGAYVRL